MSAEQIVATFEDLFTDYEKLKNGKQILEDFLVKVPQFATTTCRIITSTEVNAEFRKNVCYVMKNVLKDNWIENKVLIKERKDIKEILLNGLVLNINDFKIIEVLSLTIAELIKQEGPAGWEAYLKEVIEWMNTEDESIINTGLDALSFIFAGTDNRIHIIVPGLMPILFQIFTNPDLTEKMREKLLKLLYLAIDSFSYADGNDKKIIHACFDQTYQEWMSIFVSALQTTTRSHLNIKRYILKILTRIFSDLVHYTAKSLAVIIQPVWKFLNSNLPLFIWSTVYGVPVEQIEDGMKEAPKEIIKKKAETTADTGYEFLEDQDMLDYVDGLTIQLIELMITLTERKQLEPILRLGIFPLTNSLAYYMLFSKEQERNWFDDPNQFVADDEDEGNMISVRNGSLKIIDNLIENYGDEATQALMVISEKFLTNMKEEEVYGFLKGVFEKVNFKGSKATVLQDFDSDKLIALVKSSHFEGDHPDHVWKKREVGLLLLGKYSEDIVTFMSNKSGGSGYDLSKFLEQLIKGLDENTNPIIKGRTLWCISQYSEVISSSDILLPLFKISSLYIEKENPLPVRLMAVKSMRSFANKIEKLFLETLDSTARSEYKLNSIDNLKNLFDLLGVCNEETIHIILEALFILARMNPDFIGGLAVELSQKMVEMYQMLHRDALNGGILKDLVKLFCSQKDSYLAVSKAFLPYITEILEYKVTTKNDLATHLNLNGSTEEDFLGALFDIVRLFVKCEIADKDFESLLKLFPIILNFTQASSEISLLNHATICIKAYVMHYSEFLKKLNLTDDIFKCIFKLLHVDTNESALIYVGNLIILVFSNLLGNQVNVDILKQVILKLSKCRLPSIIQSLVLIYARLINIDTKETISFLNSFNLDGKVALKALIDKWFVQQPLFRGRNTRTSTFLALTKLFLAKDDRVDNLLVIGYNPSHTNIQEVYAPFKIFSLLIRALDFEIKSQARKAQESGRPGKVGEDFYGEDGRLDTVEDDEDFGYKDDDDDYEDEDKLQVDLDIHDDMGYMDHKFKAQEPKGKGLADIETGSACYMSEMMDFDFEAEEADEIAEEDLIYLKDVSCDLDLVGVLKEFFSTVAKEDPEYFSFCVKHLLQDDIKLLQSHIQFRNN